ncbi:MAG: DUF4398 domain-containing protein [Candidatus Schekmanbacteria bacterium]|nr:DUF4398 domain-containing protein [Candidatus Schekmanbacteria bacterium]
MKKCFFVLMMVSFIFAGIIGCATSAAPQICEVSKILNEAWENGADTKASMEYYSAQSYLKSAKDEEEEYDFDAAKVFAAKALEQAKKALEKSK